MQVSSDLIPALAMHFKHVSHSMTEGGYIGSNPALLTERDSLATQRTASLFSDMMQGRQRFAGRRGVEMNEQVEQIRAIAATSDVAKEWKIVNRLVADLGVIGWFHADGTCLPMDPSEMQCHADAGTLPRIDKVTPNFEFRRVSTCAGCKNYLIASENKGFWEDRFRTNRFSELSRRDDPEFASVAIFSKRASVAAKWLKLLDVDVEALNCEVEEKVKQWQSDRS